MGIVDTTLRDGQQSPGLVFSAAAKESMIAGLDGAGVARIEEAGPAMGPVACSRPLRSLVRNAEIVLWNRLLESDVEASLAADPHVIHVCLPVSERHLERKLGVSWDRAARLLEGAVRLAGSEGHRVSVGLEDASRAGPGSLGRAMGLLSDVGARHVRLSDTAGVLTPGRTRELVGLFKAGGFTVEFHAHDDLGLADANSLQAALAGADYVDVTLCGIGERAGNASLGGFARLAGSAPGLGLAVGAGEAAALEGAFRHLFGREWLSGAGRGPAAGGPGAASPARGRGRR
ncbi:MAG: homocitrate synthase [Deltaproteobacteria bacterium]|nr:homocitrate synthase [Deltaproteobacteria bacterium]